MPNRREMDIVNVKVSATEGKNDSTDIPINSVQEEIKYRSGKNPFRWRKIVSVPKEINSTKKQIDSIEEKIDLTEAKMTTSNLKEKIILQTSLIILLENLKIFRDKENNNKLLDK